MIKDLTNCKACGKLLPLNEAVNGLCKDCANELCLLEAKQIISLTYRLTTFISEAFITVIDVIEQAEWDNNPLQVRLAEIISDVWNSAVGLMDGMEEE